MRKALAIAIAAATAAFISIGTAAAAGDLVVKSSKYSVAMTLDRLSAALKAKGINVMARIDHAAGASKAGLKLAPTQLLIFGNPKLGTPLMATKRTIGLDLPMKVLAWQDNGGKTWVAYTRPEVLKQRHAIAGRDKIFAIMTKALGKFTSAATK